MLQPRPALRDRRGDKPKVFKKHLLKLDKEEKPTSWAICSTLFGVVCNREAAMHTRKFRAYSWGERPIVRRNNRRK